MSPEADIGELVGRTMQAVAVDGDSSITFTATTGERWKLHHEQDCCESVSIENIAGDVSDLIGHPVLVAEERDNDAYVDAAVPSEEADSETWTFYEIRTVVGSVTIRWYGESNGYYSESVEFDSLAPHEPACADTWTVAGDRVLADGATGGAAQYAAYFLLGGT